MILPKNLSPLARDLVKRILVPDPSVRLDTRDIMKHKFFEGVDWSAVECRQTNPPFDSDPFDMRSLPSMLKPETANTGPGATPLDMTSDGEGTSLE